MKILCRFVEFLASVPVPKYLRKTLFGIYSSVYNVNLNELPRELSEFVNFQDFFTRSIDASLRPIGNSKIISPVDGTLVDFGSFTNDKKINIKSFSYLLEEFIPDPNINKYFKQGFYLVLYLSPKDYHRIHSPLNCKMSSYICIDGCLKTVNPSQGDRLAKVLASNKRVITLLDENSRKIALVMVGAINVGKITNSLDNNRSFPKNLTQTDIQITKGQEIGKFNLGSTVVICLEKNYFSKQELKLNYHYKMGQNLEIE